MSEPVSGILFASIRDGNWEIYLIQPDGSNLKRLTDHPQVDTDPTWSPDGRQVAFRSRRDGSSDIFIMGSDGSHPKNLIRDPADSYDDEFEPAWHPGGELIALYTDRFQPPLGNCRGGVHHLAFMPVTGGSEYIQHFDDLAGEQESLSWSPDGKFLAFTSVCNESYAQIYLWEQATRQVSQLTEGESGFANPTWSPDGRFMAMTSSREGNGDIFILELSIGELTNLTRHPARDTQPSWSPDSKQIAFTTNRDGNDEIYVINLDGSDPRNLTRNSASDIRPAWSPVP